MITGQETESPRGRIYLSRSAEEGELEWSRGVYGHIDTCLGCRACEPACPSGVEYGQILELARHRLKSAEPWLRKRARKLLLDTLANPSRLRAAIRVGSLWPAKKIPAIISRILSDQNPEAWIPQPEKPSEVYEHKSEIRKRVYFLEGCVMSVLFRKSNDATLEILRRSGFQAIVITGKCCGALHAHSGELESAKAKQTALTHICTEDLPVITNSAGCGSHMKSYPQAFAGKVKDICEFLTENNCVPPRHAASTKVVYHDACHLAHGQGIRSQPRELLRAAYGDGLVELEESDRCCGSAGIYNLTQPKLARELLNRKWQFILKSGAETVATGNPGCLSWIRQASAEQGSKIRVIHTAEALAEAYRSANSF